MYKSIVLESEELIKSTGEFTPNYFVNHNIEAVRLACIDLMQDQYEYANWHDKGLYLQTQKEPDENFIEDSKQAILRFKERKLRKNMKEISERLQDNTLDDEMKTLLITAQINYKATLTEIHAELGTVVPSKI